MGREGKGEVGRGGRLGEKRRVVYGLVVVVLSGKPSRISLSSPLSVGASVQSRFYVRIHRIVSYGRIAPLSNTRRYVGGNARMRECRNAGMRESEPAWPRINDKGARKSAVTIVGFIYQK